MNAQSRSGKTRLNVTVDPALVADARAMKLNISNVVEAGLREAVRTAQARAWVEENRSAMESNAEWIERNGIPLAEFRMF